jgi:hypothetical protein
MAIKKNKEIDPFGNITFGETTNIMIGIIGQDAILSLLPSNEQKSFKRYLTRIYREDGDASFSRLGTPSIENNKTEMLDNPQFYFQLFFNELKINYNIPGFVYDFIDCAVWQLFYASISYTPFEQRKADIVNYLFRKQILHYFYDFSLTFKKIYKNDLINFFQSISGFPKTFTNCENILKEAAEKFTQGKLSLLLEKIYGDKSDSMIKNIRNWSTGKKATWKNIKPLLDFFERKEIYPWIKEKDHKKYRHFIVYRILTIYFINNAKMVLSKPFKKLTKNNNLVFLSNKEFDKLFIEIVTMLVDGRKPDEFYDINFERDNIILISSVCSLL